MGAFTAQRPLKPCVPQKGKVSLTWDSGVAGIFVEFHGDNVVFEFINPYFGTEKRDPVRIPVDKSQAVAFCNGVIEIIKGQEEVNKWLHEQVKFAIHSLAATNKVTTKFGEDGAR
jgi:hypothetical protein